MKVTKSILNKASDNGLIDREKVTKLYNFINQKNKEDSLLTTILYYSGGILGISAMTIFMNLSYNSYGYMGVLFLTLMYFSFGILSHIYCKKKNHSIPSSLSLLFSASTIPLAIYSIQNIIDLYPASNVIEYKDYYNYIREYWVFIELGTLLITSILLYLFRDKILMLPIALTLWFLSMDFSLLVFNYDYYNFDMRKNIAMAFGLILIMFAIHIDIKASCKEDYTFWFYLIGALSFWSGLSFSYSDSDSEKLVYFIINVMMIFSSMIFKRIILLILGSIGSLLYIGFLADVLFKDSLTFTIALVFIGSILIYLGIVWQKHNSVFINYINKTLPNKLTSIVKNKFTR